MKKDVQTNIQDELDLLELIQAMWKSKWIIILMAVLTTSMGLAYTVFQKPFYEAKISLISPIAPDIAAINYGRNANTRLKQVASVDVFNIVRAVLFAKSTLNDFNSSVMRQLQLTPKNTLIDLKGEFFGYTVTARAGSPEAASLAVQSYVDLTQKIALDKLNEALNKEMKMVKLRLKDEINTMRAQVNQKPQLTGALISLQDEYNTLNDRYFNENDISVIRLDSKMAVSNPLYTTSASRVLLVSGILGLLLGIMLITFRHIPA